MARNQHRCPNCGTDTLKRLETATRKRPAVIGAVVAIRVFRCTTCGECTRTFEISLGKTEKAYTRDRSEARGTNGYESDDSVLIEDLTHRLAVIRV